MKRRKFKETKIKPRERKVKRRRNPKRTRSTRKSSTVMMKSKNPKEGKENMIMMNLTNMIIKMLNMKGKDHTIMVNTKRTLNARGMTLRKVNHRMKKGSLLESVLIHSTEGNSGKAVSKHRIDERPKERRQRHDTE